MNATPLLGRILGALKEHDLEAVLIGNAAAAIHGAPVTTLDFDFMFRDTPAAVLPSSIKLARPSRSPVGRDNMVRRKSHSSARRQKSGQLAALKAESERQMEELIRRRLALPLEKRMNFLRQRLPGGGSCL